MSALVSHFTQVNVLGIFVVVNCNLLCLNGANGMYAALVLVALLDIQKNDFTMNFITEKID